MDALYLGYAVAGGLAVVLALWSARLRRLPVTEPMLALAAGVLLGPSVTGALVISAEVRTPLLLEVSRALLAVSLIGVALRFPVRSLRAVLRPTVLLVAVAMPLAAAVTAGLGAVLLGLPLGLAVLLGCCLSPTDPVLASGVVTGKPAEQALPADLRRTITAESGSNDGLALPLVLVALAPVLGESTWSAVGTSVYQVVVAVVVGAALGVATGWGLRRAERDEEANRPPELVLTLLLAFAVLGVARLLHSDGVLAVFAAGLAYNRTIGERDRSEQDDLDEAFNRYLVLPLFVLLGAVLPFGDWARLGWPALAFAAGVLLLRRPPVVLLLGRALGMRRLDAVFAGWFGPMGVSAVFYLALSAEKGSEDPRLFAAGTVAVVASTLLHGGTAVGGTRLYARVNRGRNASGRSAHDESA